MSHAVIRRVLTDLNSCLSPSVRMLSCYAFGYECSEEPKADDGTPIPIDTYINNGLCHAYALLARARLKEMGIDCHLTGSPTHVWIEWEGEWFDSAGTPETRWPHDQLFDYDDRKTLVAEFPFVYEALIVLSMALEVTPSEHNWAWLAKYTLRELDD